MPATQPAVPLVALHFLPQPPQLEGSVSALLSQPLAALPSQSSHPVSQTCTTQRATGYPLGLASHFEVAWGSLQVFPQNEQLLLSVVRLTSQSFAGFLSQLPMMGGEHGFSTHFPSMHTALWLSVTEQSVPHTPQFCGSFCRLVSQPSLGSVLQSFQPVSQVSTAQPLGSAHFALAWGSSQGAQAVDPLQPVAGSSADSQSSLPVGSGQAFAPGKQVFEMLPESLPPPPPTAPASAAPAPVWSMLHAPAAASAVSTSRETKRARRIEPSVPARRFLRKAGAFCRDCGPRGIELSVPRRARRGVRAAPRSTQKGPRHMARKKIALIGAGNIGGELANLCVTKELGDVVLFDIPAKESFAKGKALDLEQSSAMNGGDVRVTGTSKWEDCAGSDVMIITAGIPRKPGQSRDDLVGVNLPIIRDVADNAKKHCPNAFVIVISNPLDAMVYELKRRTGFAAEKVVGMAGVLDSARFTLFLARELGASIKDIRAMVLGGHGDDMVPVLSNCTISGVPLPQMIAKDKLSAIVDRTRKGGGEIVGLMGTSAYYAPAAAAIAMAEAYLGDQKRLLPCAAYLTGQYGYKDLYMGVPVVVGAGGVEKILEIPLNDEEKGMLAKSAASVQSVVDVVKKAAG